MTQKNPCVDTEQTEVEEVSLGELGQ